MIQIPKGSWYNGEENKREVSKNNMEETLGKRIMLLRRKRGMTQEYLAGALSISPQAISKWENDQSAPDVNLLVKLADVLETSTDYLLTGDKAPKVTWSPEDEDRQRVKTIRIEVMGQDGRITNVRIPFSLCKVMGKLSLNISDAKTGAQQLSMDDFQQLLFLAGEGVMGLLMEVDSGNGDLVRIYAE